MPINLGTRNRSNIKWGPANLYIAPGATVGTQVDFGETITPSAFTTLLANFTYMGKLEENPRIETIPITKEAITAIGEFAAMQYRSRTRAEIVVAETDNTILNALISRAQARQLNDFLWYRSAAEGDYCSFLRNVPFAIGIEKPHSWEDIEKAVITVDVEGSAIQTYFFQKQFVDEA